MSNMSDGLTPPSGYLMIDIALMYLFFGRLMFFGPWTNGFRRPWSVCSSRCYAGKAPFSVLSPLTGSRQAAWSTGIGLFLLGTQKANCKRAITGTVAALPPLPFCSIWDLTAVVSTCVFCTVAGTGVYATLLLHALSCNTIEPGSANPVCWDGVFLLGPKKQIVNLPWLAQ